MEITIVILGYLLHCFTAFALMFSCDKAKIWGDTEEPKLHMPRLADLQEEERLKFDKNDTEEEWDRKQRTNDSIDWRSGMERQEYVEKVISPAYHYFMLKGEIEGLQSNCDDGFFPGLTLQLFSLLLIVQSLNRMEIFNSWIISLFVATVVCSVSCFIISWLYKNRWRYTVMEIEDFAYDYCDWSNNYIIEKHYEYLYSIKNTVYFRHAVRKILFDASWWIYLLFFFRVPERYR